MLKDYKKPFHSLSISDTLKILETNLDGLSSQTAAERLGLYGKNMLTESQKQSVLVLFFNQFKNIMVIILLIAAVIAAVLGELTDTIIILAVLIINALFGVFQEIKAEKAIDALKKLNMPYAKVYRDGNLVQIKTDELTIGDIIEIEAGDIIPADIRLIESFNLKIDESLLTGESIPVEKNSDKLIEEKAIIAERINMAYMGSTVTYGRGKGIIVSIGMDTEIGKIAEYVNKGSSIDTKTPLHRKLEELSKYLTVIVIVIALLMLIVGIVYKRDIFEMFLISISLAVAAIPEGLPAVVTIILAIGVQKMAQNNAIVRKLASIETLGRTEVICSDKTGTLTQNKMSVEQIFFNNEIYYKKEEIIEKVPNVMLQILALCNDVRINTSKKNIKFVGDPTEIALVKYALDLGMNKNILLKTLPRIYEIPFDSVRKMMSTLHKYDDTKAILLSKGAIDVIINKCKYYLLNDEIIVLSDDIKNIIIENNTLMTSKAYRVLALAYKEIKIDEINENKDLENDLIFIGLVAMIDPPREEAKQAIKTCFNAGIVPVMITGDHRDTAVAIADKLEIFDSKIDKSKQILTGNELNYLSDNELESIIENIRVYARVSPEHKMRIVNAWKKKNKIVAMTGDGVNDAPAIKFADIGIGMGITGTDVTKNVSDIVLADDNFATIVSAIKEGRKIYDNIKKTIQFLLSSNIGEVVTLFFGTILNWNVLYPIHILWVNLVTDSLPALSLGMEKEDKDIMTRTPKKVKESIFDGNMGFSILYQGTIKGIITLIVYFIGHKLYGQSIAVTMTFLTLSLIQLTHSYNARSNTESLFSIGIFSNKYLNISVIITILLQLIVILIPSLREIFKITYINFEQWLIVIFASLSIIPIVELVKFFTRNNKTKI